MKRMIVTGGSGFIGYHLAQYLSEKDCEVTIIDNLSRGADDASFKALIQKENVIFINADMTEKLFYTELHGRYDHIYHLAARNGTKNFYNHPYEVLRINILTLMNLLEWCTQENCGSFLFASSSEGYAGTINCFLEDHENFIPTQEDIPLTIDDVMNPRFSYGGSKITGELLTANYCKGEDIAFRIIRYHNIYGPRMGFDHVLPEFIKRIYTKENPFPIFGGEETRAFCEVNDGIRATEAVMLSKDCQGEIVHIGNSQEEIKIVDLLKKLLSLAAYQPEILIKSAPKGCVIRRCPDTSKLKKLTGYEAKISLDEGLKTSYLWYLKAYADQEKSA